MSIAVALSLKEQAKWRTRGHPQQEQKWPDETNEGSTFFVYQNGLTWLVETLMGSKPIEPHYPDITSVPVAVQSGVFCASINNLLI